MRTCPCCGSQLANDPKILVDLDENTIHTDYGEMRLTPQRAEIVSVLADAWPEAVTIDRLVCKVWALREPGNAEDAVRVQISKIRKNLGQIGWTISLLRPGRNGGSFGGGRRGYKLEQLQ